MFFVFLNLFLYFYQNGGNCPIGIHDILEENLDLAHVNQFLEILKLKKFQLEAVSTYFNNLYTIFFKNDKLSTTILLSMINFFLMIKPNTSYKFVCVYKKYNNCYMRMC